MSPICSCLYRSTDTTKNYTFGLLKINLGNSFLAIVTFRFAEAAALLSENIGPYRATCLVC